jgi:hypothetical protein
MLMVWAALFFSVAAGRPRDGELSQVHFVEAARLTAEEASAMRPPGADGVRLVFVVFRKPAGNGLFTIAETRHVMFGDRRYPSGGPASPEPQTEIFDLPKFKAKVRPDLAHVLPADGGVDATVLVIRIAGPPLPADQPARVKVEVGWGEKTEVFWFTFTVPAPPAAAPRSSHGSSSRPTMGWSGRGTAGM